MRTKCELFLGIDIGTTAVKVLVIDCDGRVMAQATRGYPIDVPYPAWAEQDPREWWHGTCQAMNDVYKQGIDPHQIKSVGLTGQMHGSVFLNAHNELIRHAILWCDNRTVDECKDIYHLVGGPEKLLQLVANPALPGFTAPKILWLRKHERENYSHVNKVLLPKDYIGWRITGIFATDVSDASGMLMLDVVNRRWSEEILAALDIPSTWLAEVFESSQVVGTVNDKGAEELGLIPGTPVVAGAGDNAAGAVGNGIISSGMANVSLGTSGVIFTPTTEPLMDKEGRLHTFCHALPNRWHLMGVTLAAGGSLRWLKDTFGGAEIEVAQLMGKDPYELFNFEASQVPPGSEGLMFLPYLSGERTPHNDPYARGMFMGINLNHRKSHFVRAVMEGVSMSIKDTLGLIEQLGRLTDIRITGGGAKSMIWRQILADVLGLALNLPFNFEGPAFGAAVLAGVGAGYWSSVDKAVEDVCQAKHVSSIQPDPQKVQKYEQYYSIYKGIYPAIKHVFQQIAEQTSVY